MTRETLERTNGPATAPLHEPPGLVSRVRPLMGGHVGVHLLAADPSAPFDTAVEADAILRRVSAWADRLTRFTAASELSRLNRDPRGRVPVGPTIAAVLDWGRHAEGLTDGIVDIGLLDARLAAEDPCGGASAASPASRSWSLDRRARGALVCRPVGLQFDLDGVGKGWLADRALDRLGRHPAAAVDADGDVAILLSPGVAWSFGIADPRRDQHDLAILRLTPRTPRDDPRGGRFGLATSGTSVHRWDRGGRLSHHLIDPRTGVPAVTDVVQATVLAGTAREAEALAKAAVIVGSATGYEMLDRFGVDGAILLTDRGDVMIHPSTHRWLT